MNTVSYLCAAAILAAGGAAYALPASAANATQSACSQQYQAAKSAGTLNGQKWSDFYSSCAAAMKSSASAPAASAAASTPAPASTPQTAAAPAKKKSLLGSLVSAAAGAAAASSTGASPATQAAAAPAGGQSTQQLCSAQYQSAKSAGTLNGQKWPAFYSACAASIKNYQEPATAPAMPTVAVAPSAKGGATTKVQANYQPPANMSSGEAAFQQRIHACAAQWQSEKSSGSLPAGSQWPQFWSACNTQLKQQG